MSINLKSRLTAKLDKTPGYGPNGDCWIWTGGRINTGYGAMHYSGSLTVLTHRLMWIALHGEIPDGLYVLHRCDNPPCCNPDHLFLGTARDNNADMIAKNRHSKVGDRQWAQRHPESIVRGENRWRAKMTAVQVLAARSEYAAGNISCAKLAVKYGISASGMYCILSRRRWTHI